MGPSPGLESSATLSHKLRGRGCRLRTGRGDWGAPGSERRAPPAPALPPQTEPAWGRVDARQAGPRGAGLQSGRDRFLGRRRRIARGQGRARRLLRNDRSPGDGMGSPPLPYGHGGIGRTAACVRERGPGGEGPRGPRGPEPFHLALGTWPLGTYATSREGCAPAGPRTRRAGTQPYRVPALRGLGAVGNGCIVAYGARSPTRSAAEGHAPSRRRSPLPTPPRTS